MPVGGKVIEQNGHYVQDTRTGLLIPRSMNSGVYVTYHTHLTAQGGFPLGGIPIQRDEKTGIWKIPGYGTGFDDFFMRLIVRGNVTNVGISPVVDAGLSSLVAKMQSMASTWEVLLTGKATPVNRASEIISMANDSQVGVGDFISKFIGSLLVDNRGAFVSYVPLRTIEYEQWEGYGMRAVPLDSSAPEDQQEYYFLDMETADFRSAQGLWTLDGLQCYPTGNSEWPFWYRIKRAEKRDAWVLIHRDFGTQILAHIGGEETYWAGFGQSPTWRYLNILSQEIIRVENDVEAMLNKPPDGIVYASGLDTPSALGDAMKGHIESREQGGILYYPGTVFFGSVSEAAKVGLLQFTNPPAGYNFDTWKTWREDMLSLCFGVSAPWVVTRIGTGSLTQSGITHEISAQSGIAHLRNSIQAVLSSAVPPRVGVRVHFKSDRQTRFQVETLDILSSAIGRLQDAGGGATLTVPEIRTIVEQHGLDIPSATQETETGTVGDTRVIVDDESPEEPAGQQESVPASAGRLTVGDIMRIGGSIPMGTKVRTVAGTSMGIVTAWTESDQKVWVQHPWHQFVPGGSAAIYDADDLVILEIARQ